MCDTCVGGDHASTGGFESHPVKQRDRDPKIRTPFVFPLLSLLRLTFVRASCIRGQESQIKNILRLSPSRNMCSCPLSAVDDRLYFPGSWRTVKAERLRHLSLTESNLPESSGGCLKPQSQSGLTS